MAAASSAATDSAGAPTSFELATSVLAASASAMRETAPGSSSMVTGSRRLFECRIFGVLTMPGLRNPASSGRPTARDGLKNGLAHHHQVKRGGVMTRGSVAAVQQLKQRLLLRFPRNAYFFAGGIVKRR